MRAASVAMVAVLGIAGCVSGPGDADRSPPDPSLVCRAPCGVLVDATSADGETRWEPAIAVDPSDPRRIVISSQEKWPAPGGGRYSWGLAHTSSDGGQTWSTQPLPGGPRATAGSTFADRTWMDDSVPRFLPDGTLLWSALVFTAPVARVPGVAGAGASTGADVVVFRSSDGGLTFPEHTVVAAGRGASAATATPASNVKAGAVVIHDKQWLATDAAGVAWLVWSENHQVSPACPPPGTECTFLRSSESRDGGRTWSTPTTIVQEIVSGAFPVILPDGTRVLSYHATLQQRAVVAVGDGASWRIQDLGPSTKFPVLANDGARVYVAYPRGSDDRDGKQDVVLRWTDDLTAWSDPLVLDAPATEGRTIPALAVGDAAYVTHWRPGEGDATYHATAVRAGRILGSILLGTHEGPTSSTGDYMAIAPLPDGSAIAAWTSTEGARMAVRAARLAVEEPMPAPGPSPS